MTGFGEVIEGYFELAEQFVRDCGAEARRTATRIDAGTFDADAAASAGVRAVNLGLLGIVSLAGWAVGAPNVAKAPTGLDPLPMQDLAKEQRKFDPVTVTLTNGFGDTFGAHAQPCALTAVQTEFELVADIAHIPRAGRYVGKLNVRADSGPRSIDVTWRVS